MAGKGGYEPTVGGRVSGNRGAGSGMMGAMLNEAGGPPPAPGSKVSFSTRPPTQAPAAARQEEDEFDTFFRMPTCERAEQLGEVAQFLGDRPGGLPVKNTFIDYTAGAPSSSFVPDDKQMPISCPPDAFMSEVTKQKREDTKTENRVMAAMYRPSVSPSMPSKGSVGHPNDCKPCAWFHGVDGPNACRHGSECDFCHLCPAGEIKRRKKLKQAKIKEQRRADREGPEGLDSGKSAMADMLGGASYPVGLPPPPKPQ
mmetsp:Transcript_52522/g.115207  ORF Transcript_52522/g.115207 Transcript_52522/m.115207 type:complete len:256 (+) Transcript_52522:119-886(+)|eukprot:CAMPEP_0204268176 /NCGR_PEP_ID=MMETSP0468-20130131/11416_1 /ASSEMBLY_ACC=CAM_ASM_000383 /TAXON_ID=2969 /ORGANISM="Oxyrrhis marina" /LENGTH=255 /DNA_ID=CAMNT_0051243419 /DNA_START=121 /DNA_END=888 /DNA_ORIENTATION=+